MTQLVTTDNNLGKTLNDLHCSDESATEVYKDLSAIANIPLKELCEKNPSLIVFPQILGNEQDGIEELCICELSGSVETPEKAKLTTENLMGFIGYENTQLSIKSRFTELEREDCFLHYMLEKVGLVNLFDLPHNFTMDSCFDFLLYLCNLEINELEDCEEMQKVPENERQHILSTLMQHDNIYLQVRADINSFAGHLEGRIWKRKDENEESLDVSMISAVKQKNILAIKVPFNNHVTDYLGSELQTIIDEGIEFLLVIDSVYAAPTLLNSEILKMPELPFSTVIACENLRGIYGDDQADMENALAKLDVIHVMQCSNNISAQPFTSVTGQYLRRFESTHNGTHKDDFHILGSGRDQSVDTHEELFDRIRPEEFANLGDGAVLIDQAGYDNVICVAKEYIF